MNDEAGRAPTAIIGIGNSMRADDGVGPSAVGLLADQLAVEAADRAIDCMVLDGEATRLVEAWRHRVLAIVIDAVRSGAAPGSLHRAEAGVDDLPAWSASASSHSTGLAEAVALGRALDRMPQRLVIHGVEVADLGFGPELSPELTAALPDLLTAVGRELQDGP